MKLMSKPITTARDTMVISVPSMMESFLSRSDAYPTDQFTSQQDTIYSHQAPSQKIERVARAAKRYYEVRSMQEQGEKIAKKCAVFLFYKWK